MKNRIGKIAQLPTEIRDQLNHRLQNGRQSPEILAWLNRLPETGELLAAKFDSQPITRSNLSDWRLGGYQDWLRLQAREERIQRITESGVSLEKMEKSTDLFENFARIVVAEIAADLEFLTELKNPDKRWLRLRELSHELVRLQNGYNRSRWAELAWTRWNDRFPQNETEKSATPDKESPVIPASCGAGHPTPVVPGRAQSCGGYVRYLHYAHCGCLCRKCHAEDSAYPYWDAEHDAFLRKKSGNDLIQRGIGGKFYALYWNCDCTCPRCDSLNGGPEANGHPRKTLFRIINNTKCKCRGICKQCHAPDAEYPMDQVLKDEQLSREQRSSILRATDGISTCLRASFCQCECPACKIAELEDQTKTLTVAPS